MKGELKDTSKIMNSIVIFWVPLELNPQGGIFFLAPAGGSNPAGP